MGKKIFFLIYIILLLFFGLEIIDCLTLSDYGTTVPLSLDSVATKAELSDEDYEFIFSQTGLGKLATDAIRDGEADFLKSLEEFQTQRFAPVENQRNYLFFPTTIADVLVNGENFRHVKLPPLENGDILITKSTKTLFYRHGHSAIVVDADRGRVVEAMMLGMPSARTFVDGWESYATLMVLRPKVKKEAKEAAVLFAETKLVGVPYRLMTGLFDKDQSKRETVSSTQCSHLVWQAYRSIGVDLDSDSGWLVTPYDLSLSEEVEVVFSYGFGDDSKW